jgi:nitroreductase
LLQGRFSCRAFRPEPVPLAVIQRILDIARHTASWNNVQPWNVIVTQGEATERFRRELLAYLEASPAPTPDIAFPREYREPYLARRRECGFALYNAVGVARGDKAAYARQTHENYRLFGAPHLALISTDEALGTYGAVDCGAYVGNFMLAAQAKGVSTIAQAALAGHSAFLRAHFAIPEEQRVVCGISFGYADMTHPANRYRTTRVDPRETVRFVGN